VAESSTTYIAPTVSARLAVLEPQVATVDPPYVSQFIDLINKELPVEGIVYTSRKLGDDDSVNWWIPGNIDYTITFDNMPIMKNSKYSTASVTVDFNLNDFFNANRSANILYGIDPNYINQQREDINALYNLMQYLGFFKTSLGNAPGSISGTRLQMNKISNSGRVGAMDKLTANQVGYDPKSVLANVAINLVKNPVFKKAIYFMMNRAKAPHVRPKRPAQVAGFIEAYIDTATLFIGIVHSEYVPDSKVKGRFNIVGPISRTFKLMLSSLVSDNYFKATINRHILESVFGRRGSR
jgi:hypothetical protein